MCAGPLHEIFEWGQNACYFVECEREWGEMHI